MLYAAILTLTLILTLNILECSYGPTLNQAYGFHLTHLLGIIDLKIYFSKLVFSIVSKNIWHFSSHSSSSVNRVLCNSDKTSNYQIVR